MYLVNALSSRIELNARCRARSTSDKYSIMRSAFESVSGSVHSNGSSQRFAVSPPHVCSITAALRRLKGDPAEPTSEIFQTAIRLAQSPINMLNDLAVGVFSHRLHGLIYLSSVDRFLPTPFQNCGRQS